MTQDEIIEIARKLGICELTSKPKQDIHYSLTIHELQQFAKLVAQHEREAIYNIVLEAPFRQNLETEPNGDDLLFAVKVMAFDITSAIRARRQ